MPNEVAVQAGPSEALQYALKQQGVTVDQLEKLLVIEERYRAGIARNEYHAAMAMFKANPPTIEKDKKVSFGPGKAAYRHASLYNVVSKCSEALSKWGLSASWTTEQNGGNITVTCKVTHKLGHHEETKLSAAADTSGSKNSIQAVGSTVTYLQRYTLLSLLGLATADQDDDGNQVDLELITEQEYSRLLDHINGQGLTETKVCAFLGVEDLKKLPKSMLQKAMRLKKAAQ